MRRADPGQELKVFISYSRRDSSDLAEDLVAGLELAGFAPFLDRRDIAAGEDWEARLGGLIQEADTVVFVVSPEAVKSDRCRWEVEKALAEAKRLLPVVWKPVPESEIPEPLRRRQFVRFDTGYRIARPLAQLAGALRQDLEWIREHTRIGDKAAHWEARGRSESLLLRGDDLAAAQSWAGNRKADAPVITDLMQAFIAASKRNEAEQLSKSNAAQRRIIRMQALVSALLVIVVIGLIGWINQDYLKAEWRWYTVTQPFAAANLWPYVLTPAEEKALKPRDVFRECGTAQQRDYCPEMVIVPAGTFIMGSPLSEKGRDTNEGPQHPIAIAKSFTVAKFELTFDEWDTCVAYGDCDPNISDAGWGRGRQPVINVNWDDAQRYVKWLSKVTGKPYRLLTEAEYEYAARAGTQSAYPWGDEIGENNANCGSCGSRWDKRQPAPVGSFSPNRFDLCDMVGNVFEWVEDTYHDSYEVDSPAGRGVPPADGSAWVTGDSTRRVVRAGSWGDIPAYIRSANRYGRVTSGRDDGLGFRVARTLSAQ